MLSHSFYLQHAEACLSLARKAIDPVLRRRYEDLAIDFSEELGPEAALPPSGHHGLAMSQELDAALRHALRARAH